MPVPSQDKLEGCSRKGIWRKKGRWGRWSLIGPDGVAPSRTVGVSASVNLPLHHKVQKFSSGTGSLGWSQKKGRKTVVVSADGRMPRCLHWLSCASILACWSHDLLHFACHRWCKYILVMHVCVCVCLSLAICPHYCTDPDVILGNGRGAPSWAVLGGFAIGARVSLLW